MISGLDSVNSSYRYGFRSIFRSDSIDSRCRYGLTTVDWKDVGPLSSLTVHVSPSTVSRLYGPS